MAWPESISKPVGYSRVMADIPSGAESALDITNFNIDERGLLDSTFRLMPFLPKEWVKNNKYHDDLKTTSAMIHTNLGEGRRDEILFITDSGLRRFSPWNSGNSDIILERVLSYTYGSSSGQEVTPQSNTLYPPQMEAVGRFVYFTFCDGGPVWVWDGVRLRKLGYHNQPTMVSANGPSSDGATRVYAEDAVDTKANTRDVQLELAAGSNAGGFSVRGRVGTTDSRMYRADSSGNPWFCGGLDEGEWSYNVVWENETGAYSPMSEVSSTVFISKVINSIGGVLEELTRKFWVYNIPIGPEGTVARVILRSLNKKRLPSNDFGEPHFIHRIPNNIATDWVDDTPDGEAGSVWINRATVPTGVYFMRFFGGSLFLMRSDGHPARVWWSENEPGTGPVPESFIKGHFMDIMPETGPITGAITSRLGQTDSGTSLLVFKERSVHFISGNYPNWTSGTIREGAGLAGPGLVQATPDGSVIFFGAGTFWKLDPNSGAITDIGLSLKKALARLNPVLVRKGVSWVDQRSGEVVFALPNVDSSVNNIQFIYDYRFSGWRIRQDMTISAAMSVDGGRFVLAAGTYDSIDTVFVRGRGYASFAVTQPTAVYSTPWFVLEAEGAKTGSTYHLTDLVVTAEERSDKNVSVKVFHEWSFDDVSISDTLPAAHQEEDDIPYYGLASYNSDLYRSQKFFTARVGVDVHTTGVARAELSVTGPFCLYGIDANGTIVAGPAGRTPETRP